MFDDLVYYNPDGKNTSLSFISIHNNGVISFSKKIVRKNKDYIKNKTHVKVGYSRNNRAIIINFIEECDFNETYTPYKIFSNTKRYGMFIAPQKFLKSFGINQIDVKGRYEVTLESIPNYGDCFVIRLNKDSIINQY